MQLLNKMRRFVLELRRVLRVTKKPSRAEFASVAKVSGIGILLIGLVGFLLQMGRQLLFM